MQTQPIGVKCPRCADDIECTVEIRIVPKPGSQGTPDMRLVDLAERFAEHYESAGHVRPRGIPGQTGTPLGELVHFELDSSVIGAHQKATASILAACETLARG